MPVTLLVPHVRVCQGQWKKETTTAISFTQIAKSILILGFLG
jgi:hypothetical protein